MKILTFTCILIEPYEDGLRILVRNVSDGYHPLISVIYIIFINNKLSDYFYIIEQLTHNLIPRDQIWHPDRPGIVFELAQTSSQISAR